MIFNIFTGFAMRTGQVLALAREGAKYGVFVVAAGAMLMVKKPDGK